MADLLCPHCNNAVSGDPTLAGQTVACPSCHNTFTMPEMGIPVIAPAPPPIADRPPNSPVATHTARREHHDHRPPQKTLGQRIVTTAIVWAIIGGAIAVPVGLFSSQYQPVFGGVLVQALAQPWSPARINGILIHVFAFGLIGSLLGATAGAAVTYLRAGRPMIRRAPPNPRSVYSKRPKPFLRPDNPVMWAVVGSVCAGVVLFVAAVVLVSGILSGTSRGAEQAAVDAIKSLFYPTQPDARVWVVKTSKSGDSKWKVWVRDGHGASHIYPIIVTYSSENGYHCEFGWESSSGADRFLNPEPGDIPIYPG